MNSFVIIKPLGNGGISQSFTDVGKLCPLLRIFNVPNMSFNSFCENRFLAKISEFTIYKMQERVGILRIFPGNVKPYYYSFCPKNVCLLQLLHTINGSKQTTMNS